MSKIQNYLESSIGRKQIVALTGLILTSFVVVHLAGNLFIYGGPEPFNHYGEKLAGLRPALYGVEASLLLVFLIHIYYTYKLVAENRRARGPGYAKLKSQGKRSWSARLMPLTGTILLAFVIWHLLDFTFTDKQAKAFVNGQDLGIYGMVWNAFSDPLHSALYIIAMFALGSHLVHAVESSIQTFGWNHPKYTPAVQKISLGLGILIAVGYSTIPVYVLITNAL